MGFSDFSVEKVIFPIMNTIINAWMGQARFHRGRPVNSLRHAAVLASFSPICGGNRMGGVEPESAKQNKRPDRA